MTIHEPLAELEALRIDLDNALAQIDRYFEANAALSITNYEQAQRWKRAMPVLEAVIRFRHGNHRDHRLLRDLFDKVDAYVKAVCEARQ